MSDPAPALMFKNDEKRKLLRHLEHSLPDGVFDIEPDVSAGLEDIVRRSR